MNVRRVLAKLHLWIGIIAGAPIVVIAFTGAILAFEPELQRLEQPEFWDLAPDGQALSTVEVVARIEREHPQVRMNYVAVPDDPRAAYLVFASWPEVDGRSGARLYVNPYNGDILVDDAPGRTVSEFVRQLHRTFLVGEGWGRDAVGVLAAILMLVMIVGACLWWPARRGTLGRLRKRRDALSLHNVVGLAIGAVILVIGFTGLSMTFRDAVLPAVYTVTRSPSKPEPAQSQPAAGREPIGLSAAAAIIARQLAPARRIAALSEPAPGGRGVYVVRVREVDDLHPSGWLRYELDQYTGEVLQVRDDWTHSPGLVYENAGWALHTGVLFDLPVRVLWSIAGATPLFLFVTGLVVYRRKRGRWWTFGMAGRRRGAA